MFLPLNFILCSFFFLSVSLYLSQLFFQTLLCRPQVLKFFKAKVDMLCLLLNPLFFHIILHIHLSLSLSLSVCLYLCKVVIVSSILSLFIRFMYICIYVIIYHICIYTYMYVFTILSNLFLLHLDKDVIFYRAIHNIYNIHILYTYIYIYVISIPTLSIHLSIHLSIYLSIKLSIYISPTLSYLPCI